MKAKSNYKPIITKFMKMSTRNSVLINIDYQISKEKTYSGVEVKHGCF